jgi:hypothetical protein
MIRSERKQQAKKKSISAVLDINKMFEESLERTNDMRIATKLTERFIREQMNKDPQESHIWERAALEWQEKLIEAIRKETK